MNSQNVKNNNVIGRQIASTIYLSGAFVFLVLGILDFFLYENKVYPIIILVFFVLLSINYIIAKFGNDTLFKIAASLFNIEFIVIVTVSLIDGRPDGFGLIWTLLVPVFGLPMLGIKKGSIINGLMFMIIIIFIEIMPFIHKFDFAYQYPTSVRIRLPIIYIAVFLMNLFIQIIFARQNKQLEILNDKYKEASSHDQLTGLYNRYGFINHYETFKKNNQIDTIEFAILDIDYFKNINDKYGHQNGDKVLKALSVILKEKYNKRVARWGGEEFVLFLNDDRMQDEDKLNELREYIASYKISLDDKTDVNITLSIGAVIKKYENDSIDELVGLSDSCLYKAKNNGRNLVVVNKYID